MLGSHGPRLPDNASDRLELPNLPAPLDIVSHTLPTDDVTARTQALEAAPGLASIILDVIRQAQAADDSLQPAILCYGRFPDSLIWTHLFRSTHTQSFMPFWLLDFDESGNRMLLQSEPYTPLLD